MFLKHISLAALVCVALANKLAAQEVPWHLVSQTSSTAAPSSVNTHGIKPGPNQIVVAVIDSGILGAHPSLSGQLLPGYDMLSAPNNLRGDRSTDFRPDERDSRCGQSRPYF